LSVCDKGWEGAGWARTEYKHETGHGHKLGTGTDWARTRARAGLGMDWARTGHGHEHELGTNIGTGRTGHKLGTDEIGHRTGHGQDWAQDWARARAGTTQVGQARAGWARARHGRAEHGRIVSERHGCPLVDIDVQTIIYMHLNIIHNIVCALSLVCSHIKKISKQTQF